jgi:hypothetical protein
MSRLSLTTIEFVQFANIDALHLELPEIDCSYTDLGNVLPSGGVGIRPWHDICHFFLNCLLAQLRQYNMHMSQAKNN